MTRQEKKPRQAVPSRPTWTTLSSPGQRVAGGESRRTALSFHRKGLAVVVAVAVISGAASVAVAVSLTTMDAERISLFQRATSSSHFDVTTHQRDFQGPVQMILTVKLTNTDLAPHTANVTAQMLDADQNMVLEQTKSTGEVAGGGSATLTFVFVKVGLADDYDSTFLVVNDQD